MGTKVSLLPSITDLNINLTDVVPVTDVDNTITGKVTIAQLKKITNRVETNDQTGNYTLASTDEGKVVRMSSGSANNVTVPPNSSVAFPIGTVIPVRQVGAGLTSFVPGAGVTINASSYNMGGQNTGAALHKVDTNTWDLYIGGSGGTSDVTAPTVVSRATGSTTTIVVTFSEVVTGTTAGWSFKKNGSALAITSVAGSGSNVLTFTVASMGSGDTLLASYNAGSGDAVDGSGNPLGSFTDQAVTNSIGDTTAPVLSTATVENANPDKIVLTYNETLDGASVPATSDFAPSGGRSVSSLTVVGAVVTLTVNSAYTSADTITVSYTAGTNRIQDSAGNDAANLSAQAVTNNITPAAAFMTCAAPSGSTEAPTGTWNAIGQGVMDQLLAASTNGEIEMTYGASSSGSVMMLDDDNTIDTYSDVKWGIGGIGADYYRFESNSGTGMGIVPANGDVIKLKRTGSTVTILINGTTVYTFPVTSSAQLYAKFHITQVAGKLEVFKQTGLI